MWLNENGEVCGGSRKRELSVEKDNAGFYNAILQDKRIRSYLESHPTHRLFGEWLVPHSLKTYRDDAWRHFYIFDVCIDADNADGVGYLPYKEYQPLLEEFHLDYIAPIRIIRNGNDDVFIRCLSENNFLIQDGKGVGEGIVIKNYDFLNRYGRTVWAKIVTSEFQEKHNKVMGSPETILALLEEKIAKEYVTAAFVETELEKIKLANGGWRSKDIPQLLNRVYHELVTEEIWNICRKYKNPTINFKTLYVASIARVKMLKPEMFG